MAVITYRNTIENVIPPWNRYMLQEKICAYDLSNHVIPVHHMTNVAKRDGASYGHGALYKKFECRGINSVNFDHVVCNSSHIFVTSPGIGIVEKLQVSTSDLNEKVPVLLETAISLVRKYFYDVESETGSYGKYLTYAISKIEVFSSNIINATVVETFEVCENDPEKYYILLRYKSDD